jgi:dTDP-4-dehydrorhamnose 3,5-epimerase-like enzyme
MSKRTNIFDCCLIQLPKIGNRNGFITAINNGTELPFSIRRVFYLYDIPAGESRGSHAHRECHQFLIAASGSFEVMVDDGRVKKTFSLNQPELGLHIPPGIWASEQNFSAGSICLVMASHIYAEEDYLRDYTEYINFKKTVYEK